MYFQGAIQNFHKFELFLNFIENTQFLLIQRLTQNFQNRIEHRPITFLSSRPAILAMQHSLLLAGSILYRREFWL